MRFESVTAHAFGPFCEQMLHLAPGLSLIFGPNEAGKSTWHAALYAGLCGQRRGGGATREQRQFRARHRPWDGSGWRVSAIVRLEDGRRIELRHDLDGRVDCSATDALLGRDCSAEIVHDGAPDGSRWLGLDRRAYLATACVRQADLRQVADPASAALLQEHLQRAAATAGADATAAQALAAIQRFRAEQVGRDSAGSGRPLRRAIEAVAAAEADLQAVRTAYAGYLDLTSEADARQAEAEAARRAQEATRARSERPAAGRTETRRLAAGALAALGLLLLVLGYPIAGLPLTLLGAAGLVWSYLHRRPQTALADETAVESEPRVEYLAAEAARLRGQLEERSRTLGSVAAVEEALAQARAELERLRALERTLELTSRFLELAQERIHRDLAPSLAAAVQRWLPAVTGGRYEAVRIDPRDLNVEVRAAGGAWRNTALLSHGTGEQVYLLLRVALAQQLTRRGEICPLILDDVTAQCDAERTLAVLEVLHTLSRERQVILFSQEVEVLRWARTALREPADRIACLEPTSSASS